MFIVLYLANNADDVIIGSASLAGSWNEYTVPGNLRSICVTKRHVWIVDKNERFYYSFLDGKQSFLKNKSYYFLFT